MKLFSYFERHSLFFIWIEMQKERSSGTFIQAISESVCVNFT